VQQPALFLELAAAHRATFAWLPNFAFRVLAARVPATFAGDLSSLKAIVNCGEPVRASVFDAFLARFGRLGITPETLQCSYGMAENTFAITQTAMGGIPRRERGLLSCGAPLADHEVRIRDGEIELRSPCLFAGYDAAEGKTLDADGWFATGDLGYFSDGELFVSGRIKDMIIHRGVNLHPEDVEEVLGQVPGCKAGRAIVFGVFDEEAGTEKIIALLEEDQPEGGRAGLLARARAAVFENFGVLPSELVVVAPNSLLKSTSGKASRSANRELYLQKKLIT
jgi:acyl-CoA synthetase (AMP-forming)/AMP-acid ligase II